MMGKEKEQPAPPASREGVISIIGPGMRVVGDCETEGTLRIEGTVEGTVRAGKAIVVGKDGVVEGDLITQDAVIGGRISGTVVAESRLELQATCVIDGEIRARRIKLDEGGKVNGKVQTGDVTMPARTSKLSGQPAYAQAQPGAPPARSISA
jgi:cytoskeletal protein CcmA (bactofilin family)